jgi:hypothetical protein
MITKEVVGDRLLAYLNGRLSLEEFVDWAEQSFIDAVLAPDEDVNILNEYSPTWRLPTQSSFP